MRSSSRIPPAVPVILPYRNVTTSPVTVHPEGAEEPTDAHVTGIRAGLSADGLGAEVSFRTSDGRRDLLLFWGTSRPARPEDLLGSTSRLTIDAGQARFTVPVLAGVDYYFAVLDAEAWKLGRARLAVGENVTADPFQVPVGPGTTGFVTAPVLRPFPLPALDLGIGVQTGAVLDAAVPLALPADTSGIGATPSAPSRRSLPGWTRRGRRRAGSRSCPPRAPPPSTRSRRDCRPS